MNKIFEMLNFIKDNLNGNATKFVLGVIFTLAMYKLLNIFGLILCLLFAIGIDVCNTTNIKQIYNFFKTKFFPILIIALLITGCHTHKEYISNNVYGISHMSIASKDTITNQTLKEMVSKKEMPPLNKFSKSVLKNTEENKVNNYYVYYDSKTNKLFNVKELINNNDTTYVVEKKLIK